MSQLKRVPTRRLVRRVYLSGKSFDHVVDTGSTPRRKSKTCLHKVSYLRSEAFWTTLSLPFHKPSPYYPHAHPEE